MNTATASPTPLPTARDTITRLLDGAVERAERADVLLAGNDVAGSQAALDAALDIVDVLRGALDLDNGGNLPLLLDYVYAYASLRLLEAREHGDRASISEAIALLERIASGWRDLPDTELLAA